MQPGRITQTVYRRSVLPQLHKEGAMGLLAPGRGEACSAFACGEGAVLVSGVSLCGTEPELALCALAQAANHLAAHGARVRGADLMVLLPETAGEEDLGTLVELAARAAKEQDFALTRADGQTIPGLPAPVVQAQAFGSVGLPGESAGLKAKELPAGRRAAAGQEIVMAKPAGLEGTLRILRRRRGELDARFPAGYLEPISGQWSKLFSLREMQTAAAAGVSAMHQITDGGVLAALWDLAEEAGIGLAVDLRKMPVMQETVEVCECYHLNPYQLTSAGSFLAVTSRGEELADALHREGAAAAVIGYTTDGRERTVRSRDEIRYLGRPAPDELTKIER